MDGGRDAFVFKSEFCIVMYKPVLTGKHKAPAVFDTGVGYGGFDKLSRKTPAAVFRKSIYTEYHLPASVFIVHVRMLIHFISKIGFIGRHAVNKACKDELSVRSTRRVDNDGRSVSPGGGCGSIPHIHKPEVVRIDLKPCGYVIFCGGCNDI